MGNTMKKLIWIPLALVVAGGLAQAAERTGMPYRIGLEEATGRVRVRGARHDVEIMMLGGIARLNTERLVVEKETDAERSLMLGAGAVEGRMTIRQDGMATWTSTTATGVVFFADIAYGVVPGFFLVDVVHNLKQTRLAELRVPSENLVVGLLEGGQAMLVCAWPPGKPHVKFMPAPAGGRAALAIETGGLPVHFALFEAPGIWHQWTYDANRIEQDVRLDWRRPFQAVWKTDLLLGDAPLAFTVGEGRSSRSWPGIGRAIRPLWSVQDETFLRLGGRIRSEDDVVIYPASGHEKTPQAFLESCSEATGRLVKDLYQTRPYPPSPVPATNGGFSACWGSTLLQTTVYQSGAQSRDVAFLKEHMRSRVASVLSESLRHEEYHAFAVAQLARIDAWKAAYGERDGVTDFLDQMAGLLTRLQDEHGKRMRSRFGNTAEEHRQSAFRLEARLCCLLDALHGVNSECFPEFADIMGQYRGLRSLHEGLGMQFGQNMRRLYRAAGQQCASSPEAVACAEALRAAIRETLRSRRWETAN